MSHLAFEIPGETPVERAKEALRRVACIVAFHADIDPLVLYDTRGTSEETYWRHVWIFQVRTALDIQEADIARALDVHHDTIANACHHIEDVCSHDGAAADLEFLGETIVKHWAMNRAFRVNLDAARAALKRERKRDREEERRLRD